MPGCFENLDSPDDLLGTRLEQGSAGRRPFRVQEDLKNIGEENRALAAGQSAG
jgi:hypothetical protein